MQSLSKAGLAILLALSATSARVNSSEIFPEAPSSLLAQAGTSNRLNRVQILLEEVKAAMQSGRAEQAIISLKELLEIAEKAEGPAHALAVVSRNSLAETYRNLGNYREAERLYSRSLAVSEEALGPRHPETANALNNLALVYSDQGRAADAERLYLRAVAILERSKGESDPSLAVPLNNLAMIYANQGRLNEAEKLYLRSLKIDGDKLGANRPELALRLNNIAELYKAQGRYAEAESNHRRALAIREQALEPGHPDIAASLNNLAMIETIYGRYKEARDMFQRALFIYEKAFGPESQATAIITSNLGSLSQATGSYTEAEELFRRALRISEKSLGGNHPTVATGLNNLADLYRRQARYEEAMSLQLRSLQIREKTLGANHPDTAVSLNNLAGLYEELGNNEEAEVFHRRALSIRKNALGDDHIDTAAGMMNLAGLYFRLGRYAEAESLYARSLDIHKRALGPEDLRTSFVINNLAVLRDAQGRHAEAGKLYQEALRIREARIGLEHPDTAFALFNLAAWYSKRGDHINAELFHKRALAIRKAKLGLGHPETAASLGGIADSLARQKRYTEAEQYYISSISVYNQIKPLPRDTLARVQNNLAELYARLGSTEEAQSYYQKALAGLENTLGLGHPSSIAVAANLAAFHISRGRGVLAVPLLSRITTAQAAWLRNELPLQPRDLRSIQLRANADALAMSILLLDQEPATAHLALEARLNRVGLLAEIEQRQRLLYGGSKAARDLGEQLAGLDRQLASVTLTSKQRQQLSVYRQQLETQLYQQLPALRINGVTNEQIAAVLRELAPQGLLVEFQRYRPLMPSKTGIDPEWAAPRYVALTLRPDGRITAIKLGDAAPIDTAIARAVDASAQGQEDALALWGQVSRLLFTPLQSELKGVQELFLSPDSELNRIPFAALPVGNDTSKLLSDVVQLRILTTGRDLVRLQTPAPAGASAPVVMANPQFDARVRSSVPASGSTAASSAASPRRQRSAAQQTGRRQWDPLPATEKEAQVLAPLLKADKPITGDAATETRALAVRSPRILHIASHGFFDPEPPAEANQRPAGGHLLAVAKPSPLSEDPLLRSGIVLAGANHPDADPNDDGHLTAAEVTGMDLRNTELVTLSACETGLGSVRSGEGVYGLQRALTVAGSRSTLLSLWKVDDGATAAFMAEFYKRLMAGEGRADALRNTQAAFRNHSNKLYRDVYVWGAFQLTGDWRPLSTR